MKKLLLTAAVASLAIGMNAQSLTPQMKRAIEAKKFEKALNKDQFRKFNVDGKQMTIQQMTPAQKAKLFAPKKDEAEAVEPHNLVDIPATATPAHYALSGYFYNSWFGLLFDTGVVQTVYTEGNDAYFSNLFPSLISGNFPAKGSVDATTGAISVPVQALYGPYDYYGDGSEIDTLMITPMTVDEEGNFYLAEGDIQFKKDAETGSYYMVEDTDTTVIYFGIKDQFDNLWTISANYKLDPYTPTSEPVALPEGAVPQDYSYKYISTSDSLTTKCALYQYYQNGNDVYLNDLAPDFYGWVKGTVGSDGKLTVPSGQFLGYDNSYYTYLKTGKDYTYSFVWTDMENWEYEENEDYTPTDSVTFTKVGDKWVLDEGQVIFEAYADGTLYGKYGQFEIKPYAGDAPAIPSDPTVTLTDYTESYGQWVLSGSVASVDVNNDYINPAKIEVAIYEDGDVLTLSPDDGYYLDEDVTWMPYGFYDNNNGYDINFTSLSPAFYLYESLFTELGLQVRYTVDGVTNYSNIVYVNSETYENDVVEVNHATGEPLTTGISSVKNTQNTTKNFYNLAGQKVTSNFKGIVIANGKKMMK